ncbi:MAG: hypothetical protein Fur0046_06270 [Cyanobacteria bacterium J069]
MESKSESESKTAVRTFWQRLIPHRSAFKQAIALSAMAGLVSVAALGLTSSIQPAPLQASDHDDGDIDVRSRALSLTDLYVFREIDQNSAARAGDLVLVLNTNPRSLARQQYYFSSNAQYDIKIARVANVNGAPVPRPDLTLRFTFAPPNKGNRQVVTLTTLDGNGRSTSTNSTTGGGRIFTTALTDAVPRLNTVRARGSNLTVFAGLREDPFFFDVEAYFRVRAAVAGFGPAAGFRSPDTAIDFTKGYNVNTIVVRVPQRLLAGGGNVNTFDVWGTINLRDPRTRQFVQVEQIARPGINELLTTGSQTIYETYNRTQPARLNSTNGAAIRDNITAVLKLVGNNDTRANALVRALLPDVMRIDTTVPSGYGNKFSALGSPAAGRMLLDDVVDASLGIVTNGAITTDNVSYEGTPGNPAQGHQPLAPSFPYLAPPN